MNRQYFFTILLTVFFITVAFHGGHVYAAISGDETCGATAETKCGITDITKIFHGIFSAIISIGLPLLVVFIIYRFVMAWYALQEGNANAYKEATKKAGQGILGFIMIVAIMGGIFITILKYLGVQDFPLRLLQQISSISVERAYAIAPVSEVMCNAWPPTTPCVKSDGRQGLCQGALCMITYKKLNESCVRDNECDSSYCNQTTKVCSLRNNGDSCHLNLECQSKECSNGVCVAKNVPVESPPTQQTPVTTDTKPANSSGQQLPNPLGITSLYDFILAVLATVMKFFIYPALIAMWVWSGFSYVLAQGAPEKLAKTHKLLMWAVVTTLIVFMIQGFLVAIKGSVETILPGSTNG